jgi:hypothetical protein
MFAVYLKPRYYEMGARTRKSYSAWYQARDDSQHVALRVSPSHANASRIFYISFFFHAMLAPSLTRYSKTGQAQLLLSTPSTTWNYLYYQADVSREPLLPFIWLSISEHFCCYCCTACICSSEDHLGPTNKKGRGGPEIDIVEAEHNTLGTSRS